MHGRKVWPVVRKSPEACAIADLCPKIGVKGLAAARRKSRKSSGRKVVKSKADKAAMHEGTDAPDSVPA